METIADPLPTSTVLPIMTRRSSNPCFTPTQPHSNSNRDSPGKGSHHSSNSISFLRSSQIPIPTVIHMKMVFLQVQCTTFNTLLPSRTLDSDSCDRVLRVLRTPFVLLLSFADSVPTVILEIRSSRSFALHTYLLSIFSRLCFHGDSCDRVFTVLRITISPDTIHYVFLSSLRPSRLYFPYFWKTCLS